jgi:hypothetical protein
MNTGVGTSPWGVLRIPARARPDVATTENENTRQSIASYHHAVVLA